MNSLALIFLVALLGVFAAGCSGLMAAEEADVRQAFGVPAGMPLKDLGPVQLHPGVPKRMSLGKDGYCTLSITPRTNGQAQLKGQYELADSQKDPVTGVEQPFVFRPDQVPAHWRLCLMPPNRNFAVALRPVIIP